MIRYKSPKILRKVSRKLEWEIKTQEKEVFFTFDDGPHPEITYWVKEQLENHGSKGTFFSIGNNFTKYPEVSINLLESGHSLGNHTFNHENGWKTDKDIYLNSIKKTAELIDSKMFRPPYGKIPYRLIGEIAKDYRIIMWSLLSRDFEATLNTHQSLQQMQRNLKPGSILVFHDSEKAEKNLKKLLVPMLDFAVSEGYKINCL